MMTLKSAATPVLLALAASLAAASAASAGDPAAGEKIFAKCKVCHSITAPDGTAIQKGGKVGPDLYGVIGRQAGTYEGFKYGPSIVAAGAAGLVWDEEKISQYDPDPGKFLQTFLNDPKAKSNMIFKLPSGAEDVAAYIASVGPKG